MMVNWDLISPEEFEELCYHILASMGFANLEWHGQKGSDRGRDIVGQKTVLILPGKEEITLWLVQCKRYTKKSLTRQDLDDSILWAKAYKPSFYLLITTTVLNSATRDWLESVEKDLSFRIQLIERTQLEELVRERIDYLRPYIPEKLYRELSIEQHVPHTRSTTLEDLLGLRTVPIAIPLKAQIFGKTVVPQNIVWEGPIYGQSVIVEQGSHVNGHVYARREIAIGRGSTVKGPIVSPGSIELNDCEISDICGSQIMMYGSCVIHGKFITDRDTYIPPHSRISSIFCSGSNLEIGEGSIVDNVVCKGVTVIDEDVKITGGLKCSEVKLKPRCTISWVSVKGNVTVPENSVIANLATKGSIYIDMHARVTELYTVDDVELCSRSSLQEITCRNLLAGDYVMIEKLRARGSVTVRGEGGGYQGRFIIADGDVYLPNDSNAEVISSKGDVILGQRCHVKFLAAHNLKALDNLECGNIRCSGSVELGENCIVRSLQAVEDIRFEAGLRSEDWTIFSQKGDIQGQGEVQLGDTKIAADATIKYERGNLLTALIERDQLELIEGLTEKRGRSV